MEERAGFPTPSRSQDFSVFLLMYVLQGRLSARFWGSGIHSHNDSPLSVKQVVKGSAFLKISLKEAGELHTQLHLPFGDSLEG